MKEVSFTDMLVLLGQKEVELAVLRQQLAEATAKLAEYVPKDAVDK